MKITFLCAIVSQNGGSRVTALHARNLLARGHDVTVISRKPRRPSVLKKLTGFLKGQPPKPLVSDRTVYFDPLGQRHLQISGPVKPSDLPDADVLIATWWETAFDVAAMPPEKGQKVYFVQHHEVHDHLPKERSSQTYLLPMKKIVVSQWLKDIMEETYGDTSVAKVPNAVDVGLFNSPPRSRNSSPTVGLMYSRTPFKGVKYAVEALAKVRQAYPDLKVVAFGKKEPGPDLPLPEGTAYFKQPAQTDLSKHYAAGDAWIVPSLSEGFGLPILEAMACRTPVISTKVGAACDLIEDGVNGYLAEVSDSASLADALSRLLEKSPDAWAAMSEAAYTRAHGYTWDDATALFEAALQDLVTAESIG